jgi:hypothetical protein
MKHLLRQVYIVSICTVLFNCLMLASLFVFVLHVGLLLNIIIIIIIKCVDIDMYMYYRKNS